MHDIRLIRENPEAFDEGLRRRGLGPRAESLIALDERRRASIAALQHAQERRNAASKQIGAAMARKDSVAAEDFRAEVAEAKAKMPELEAAEREALAALESELAAIPNLPLADTPDGKYDNDNVELRRHGAPPALEGMNKPREHYEIGEALGLMDFDVAAKLLERRCHLAVAASDVFVSTVGGLRVNEPAADLGIALALVSAVTGIPIEEDVVACGEVGLAGELRQVHGTERRLAEAARLGFRRAVVPQSSPDGPMELDLLRAGTLLEAVRLLLGVVPAARSGPRTESGGGSELSDGRDVRTLVRTPPFLVS